MQLQTAMGQEGSLHYPHSSLGHCYHRMQPLQEADMRAFRMILPQPLHITLRKGVCQESSFLNCVPCLLSPCKRMSQGCDQGRHMKDD